MYRCRSPGLADHIDAVGFHPYRYPFTAPEDESSPQESLADTCCAVAALLEDLGAGDLSPQVTEIGWHTASEAFSGGATEDEQAAWLVRSALLAFAQGVELYAWYTFRDSGDDPADQEQMFGLYGYDDDPLDQVPAAPKAAATALGELARALGGHDRIEDRSVELGLDETTYAYELSGGGGTTTVLWSTGETVQVLVPGRGTARLRDAAGRESEVEAGRGAWEIDVGPMPAYLVQEPE